MTDTLTLLVIYARDLEKSLRFYSACGLTFVRERHGTGPNHYATVTSSGTVLELYPAGDHPPTRTRLGFGVDDAAGTLRTLAAAGWPDAPKPRDRYYGRVWVVHDPDGNAVELVQR